MDRGRASVRGPQTAGIVAAGVWLGLCLLPACGSRWEPTRSPDEFSVILVTLDTTRADRIGAFGGTAVPTPNLDRTAREGVRFDDAIAQAPLTLPSHATILTGRYPASHGVRHNGVFKLPDSEETLAERLSEQHFTTAAFVGAFVLNHGFGTEQGFETYSDIPASGYTVSVDSLSDARRSADDVNAAVFDWLDKRPEGRFFLWVHYYDAHHPYNAPEKAGRTLQGAGYDRCISYLDAVFGDLEDRLRRDGLLDNVVLVVAGDHGESLGEHREGTHGIFLYESALKVPLFIRAPGLVPAGGTVSGPAELVDLAPTILDLLKMPALEKAEGVSLVPRITGHDETGRAAFAETYMPRIEFGWSELRMVQDARYKYIQAPRPELYDLREDPGELHNLVDARPDRAAAMSAELEQWVKATANPEAEGQAQRALSPEEEAKLRSLGYLGTIAAATAPDRPLPDPKDHIEEALKIYQARELTRAGEPDKALHVLDGVLAVNPANHLARNSKIQALVHLKRLPDAEAEALAAVEVASRGDAPALLERARRTLASIYWMEGKNGEAEHQYRLAVDLNRDDNHAAVFGGLLLGAAGGIKDAMAIVDQVLERDPKDRMAMAARFELQLSQNQRDEAYATAKSLADLEAGDWDTLFKAGKLARDYRDPRLAVRLFRLASKKKKQDPDILGHLGTSLLAAGDLDGAEKALLEAKRLRPDDPRAYFYLENVALLRNEEAKARDYMNEVVRLDPEFVGAKLNLARWLGDHRRFDEAVAVVQETLADHPGNPEAQKLLEQIRTLSGQTATLTH